MIVIQECEEKEEMKEIMAQEQKSDEQVDSLTKCYNRIGFINKVTKLLNENPKEYYTLIYSNICNFKVINEIYGFDNGDKILIDYSERLKQEKHLVCGRMDSDHFILCIRKQDFDTDILLKLSSGVFCNIQYRVRFGIYGVKDRTLSVNAMCDRAKAAKKYITNEFFVPYAIWDERMIEQIVSEGVMATDLTSGLNNHEFCVVYQPIVDAKTKKVVSAESLIRWEHHQYGMISPVKFIPVLEKTSAITKLDYFVGSTVFQMIHKRILNKLPVVPISINTSRADFHTHQMAIKIVERAQNLKIPSKLFRLEVTESIYSVEEKVIQRELDELRNSGVQIMLDDFGSGYSSFNTLHNISVDIIKIDMKFVEDLEKNEKSKVIIKSIIDMAHNLKCKVVCEGVETEENYITLRDFGCDYIQGYYFYKPMPETQFLLLLEQQKTHENSK